jgi:hypothetical protein
MQEAHRVETSSNFDYGVYIPSSFGDRIFLERFGFVEGGDAQDFAQGICMDQLDRLDAALDLISQIGADSDISNVPRMDHIRSARQSRFLAKVGGRSCSPPQHPPSGSDSVGLFFYFINHALVNHLFLIMIDHSERLHV